jgi:site-specific DNA-cytosine methylase
MRILVACEESQEVTKEFRKLGHEAYSCDIINQSGGHPEWHIMEDVLPLLNGNCSFYTTDGIEHKVEGKWDMIIGFPPCTYLTVTGNRWFNEEKYGDKARERKANREEAKQFFLAIANADCDRIAIENPVGIMSSYWRKPDQIIQPWMFGDAFEKKTCLWLKGLPKLTETNVVTPPERTKFKSGRTMPAWYADAWHLPKEERAKLRSKTFHGVAKAMGTQWSDKTETVVA